MPLLPWLLPTPSRTECCYGYLECLCLPLRNPYQSAHAFYGTFSLFIYLGLVGTTFALYCDEQGAGAGRRRWILSATIVVIALAIPTWASCLRAGQKSLTRAAQQNSRLLCALKWMDVFPTNPDLKLILPYLNVLR